MAHPRLLIAFWISFLHTLLAIHGESYHYGNGVWPRDHVEDITYTNILLHTDMGFPHKGNITGWNIFFNNTGNINCQVWRQGPENKSGFVLIGMNNFTIDEPGFNYFSVGDGQIEVEAGDYIGFIQDNKSLLTYSKPTEDCIYAPYYLSKPAAVNIGDVNDFEERRQDGCKIYPLQAEVDTTINTITTAGYAEETSLNGKKATSMEEEVSSSKQSTSFKPSPQTASHPSQITHTTPQTQHSTTSAKPQDLRLLNGRHAAEGIVVIRGNRSQQWYSVCDEGWNDRSAAVVCRTLGYRGGVAKYHPFFGSLENSYLKQGPLICNGSEHSLHQCHITSSWQQDTCLHGYEAATQCFIRNNEAIHVFGHPAVPRNHNDHEKGMTIFLPHPRHPLPWTTGTIRQWAFYLNIDISNMSNVSLQVWHPYGGTQYSFVGETNIHLLSHGHHILNLTGSDERLHFEAGDIIGIKFDKYNPIPYDLHPEPCGVEENLLSRRMFSGETLSPGQVYQFQTEPSQLEGCRIYSIYATYRGSERFGSHMFSLGHSLYKIVTGSTASWDSAVKACTNELGLGAGLVHVDNEAEYSGIVGMLNSMDIVNGMWIGAPVGADTGEGFRNWAQCHPRRGEQCVYIQRQVDNMFGDSNDMFYMFTDSCHIEKHFLCEKSPYQIVVHGEIMTSHSSQSGVDPSPDLYRYNATHPGDKNIISQKVIHKGPSSILIAPVTMAVLLFICLLIIAGIIVYRKQRRKLTRDGEKSESTVRFVSLYDKAALSSMDC